MKDKNESDDKNGKNQDSYLEKNSLLSPIQSQKLYITASNQLFDQIKAGLWPPGAKLPPERELSKMLGISRASVRQALSTLEAIGVLRSRPGVGHFVDENANAKTSKEVISSVVNEGDPNELLEARRIVEPEVARLSAIYRDSDDLSRLYTVIDEMESFEKYGDFVNYLRVDFNFHLELSYATHNPVIIDLVKVLVDRMKAPPWQIATYKILPNTLMDNRNDHLAILEAVAAHNPKEARQLMISHLTNIARNLRNISSFDEMIRESADLDTEQ